MFDYINGISATLSLSSSLLVIPISLLFLIYNKFCPDSLERQVRQNNSCLFKFATAFKNKNHNAFSLSCFSYLYIESFSTKYSISIHRIILFTKVENNKSLITVYSVYSYYIMNKFKITSIIVLWNRILSLKKVLCTRI